MGRCEQCYSTVYTVRYKDILQARNKAGMAYLNKIDFIAKILYMYTSYEHAMHCLSVNKSLSTLLGSFHIPCTLF